LSRRGSLEGFGASVGVGVVLGDGCIGRSLLAIVTEVTATFLGVVIGDGIGRRLLAIVTGFTVTFFGVVLGDGRSGRSLLAVITGVTVTLTGKKIR
jgi:hypothetical protein